MYTKRSRLTHRSPRSNLSQSMYPFNHDWDRINLYDDYIERVRVIEEDSATKINHELKLYEETTNNIYLAAFYIYLAAFIIFAIISSICFL